MPKFAIFGIRSRTISRSIYAVWVVALICVAIGLNIDRSRIGRALKAIAASETAAGSVGIDIVKYKVQMFVISAGMASVAGSLGAHYLRAMDPNVYGFAYSLNLLTGVIIGGLTSVWGGALGATVITGLRELLRSSVAAAVGIGHHGRADRDRADRVSARACGRHLGALFDRLAGGRGGSARPSRSRRILRRCRPRRPADRARRHRDAGGRRRRARLRQSARRRTM